MKALIECRMAGCGWVGECGPVAKCGRCGSSYIRIAGVRIESGQGVAS